MNRISVFLLVLVIIFTTKYPARCEPVGFCYYQPSGDLAPEDIDPEICTHIIVFSVSFGVNDDIVASTEVTNAIEKVCKLKSKNPELKVSVSLHDKMDSWSGYQEKKNVTENVMKFVKQNNLDGFDIYLMSLNPVYDKSNTCTKVNGLLEELTKSFNRTKWFLSACISYKPDDNCNTWTVIQDAMDFVILRAYGFSGSWDETLKHASPLNNTISAADNIHNLGIFQGKIIIGFPACSWPQHVKSNSSHHATSPAIAGTTLSHEDVFAHVVNSSVSYSDICSKYRNASYEWDDTSEASYLHTDTDWLSFESRRSLCYKTTWLVSNNYTGGYMLWTLDMDDHKNACGFGRFPLATYLKANIVVFGDFSRCNMEPYLAFLNKTKDQKYDQKEQKSVEKLFDKLKNVSGGDRLSAEGMSRVVEAIEDVGELALKNRTIAKQMLLAVGDVMNMDKEESSASERGIGTDRVLFLLEKFALKMEVHDGVRSVISTDSVSVSAFIIKNESQSFIVSMKFEADDSIGQSNDTYDIEGPTVAVPSDFLRKLVKKNIPRIQVIAYRNANLFINTKSQRNPGDHSVVSIVVDEQIEFNTKETVLKYKIPIVGREDKFDCVFWDKTRRIW